MELDEDTVLVRVGKTESTTTDEVIVCTRFELLDEGLVS